MTRRTVSAVITLTIVEESDEPFIDTDGAELDEPSQVVQCAPKPVLAKCGPQVVELARRIGGGGRGL